jgi:hypothetical protein
MNRWRRRHIERGRGRGRERGREGRGRHGGGGVPREESHHGREGDGAREGSIEKEKQKLDIYLFHWIQRRSWRSE